MDENRKTLINGISDVLSDEKLAEFVCSKQREELKQLVEVSLAKFPHDEDVALAALIRLSEVVSDDSGDSEVWMMIGDLLCSLQCCSDWSEKAKRLSKKPYQKIQVITEPMLS